MKGADPTRLAEFRRALARQLGLRADSPGMVDLQALVGQRARRLGISRLDQYLDWASHGPRAGEELEHLAAALTVPETYFFRNAGQMQAIERELVRRAACGQPMRVLSAGCATGEEPYSVAMLALRCLGPEPEVSIVGADASRAALDAARCGSYPGWSLRQTADDLRERFFIPRGDEHQVIEPVRRLVRFEIGNLADAESPLWAPASFDLILCRNVLMYLEEAAAQAVVARLAAALSPGGLLLLGDAESLHGAGDLHDLEVVRAEQAFFYRRRWPRPSSEVPPPAQPEARKPRAAAARAPAPPAPRVSLEAVLERVRSERFDEALKLLGQVDDPGAPTAVLLRGAVLLAQGQVDAAEASGERLLELDRLDPVAHHLIALCRAHKQDVAGAIEHERAAIYLEPGFALSHLHMGRLLARRGRRRQACRELVRAAALLPAEDERRLTLFGGGLGGEALAELCRAELRRLEGEA